MKEPQPNPQVADLAPAGPKLTAYDEDHCCHLRSPDLMLMRKVPR